MVNQGIKETIQKRRLKQWEVANAAGISQDTLVRWLRTEMTEERRKRIEQAISELVEAQKNELGY